MSNSKATARTKNELEAAVLWDQRSETDREVHQQLGITRDIYIADVSAQLDRGETPE